MSAYAGSAVDHIAQTNLQLFQQMRANGYSEAELAMVSDAYQLAIKLFASQFRACGRPFVTHLIGTSAVLVWLKAPVHVVVAGLLHSVYQSGDFANSLEGMTAAKRGLVRAVVGKQAEELVTAYTIGSRSLAGIEQSYARFAMMSADEREVLLMQLANELDDYRDLAANYAANSSERIGVIQRSGEQQAEMAERLGHPELARALRETYTRSIEAVIPAPLRSQFENARAVIPQSCRLRYGILRRRLGVKVRNRLRRHLGIKLPW
jgi:(p)ppGpp synthase/HD superfamily hydrolase